MKCIISDCPDRAICFATVIPVTISAGDPRMNNYAPMCKFHCGPGHGNPGVCLPV